MTFEDELEHFLLHFMFYKQALFGFISLCATIYLIQLSQARAHMHTVLTRRIISPTLKHT